MKGMVFTEFLELVEARYSPEFVEDLIEEADLPSKGVYAATGTYPPRELVALVDGLHRKTGVPVKDLMQLYGEHLFSRFLVLYPAFFRNCGNAFDFLEQVEHHIHKEVKKLYPDANLPSFIIEKHTEREFAMTYVSERGFTDLCEGLIRGALRHFKADAVVRRIDLVGQEPARARFEIAMTGAA
jgi:hypothetical protein